MAHIHTDPGQHDLTASAFIVRTDLPEPVILLHMHRRIHKWMHFGGHVELHENPWQAVAHEVKEESGYDITQLMLLQPDIQRREFTGIISHPFPAAIITGPFPGLDHFHTDITYGFITSEDPKHTIKDGESQEFRAFTRDELAALGEDEILPNVQEIALLIMDDYAKNWKQVAVTNLA